MAHNQPAQRELTEAQADRIATLPARGTEVARVVWSTFASPWYFHSRSDGRDEAGRFDLERPQGTCHFGRDPMGALAERLCDPDELDRVISYTLLERLTVWIGELDIEGNLTDLTDRASRVTIEIGTMTPYDVPWQIADTVFGLGRVGLQWMMRFDPSGARGVAVFGPASAPGDTPAGNDWPPLATRHPATRWAAALDGPFEVSDVPPMAAMTPAVDP